MAPGRGDECGRGARAEGLRGTDRLRPLIVERGSEGGPQEDLTAVHGDSALYGAGDTQGNKYHAPVQALRRIPFYIMLIMCGRYNFGVVDGREDKTAGGYAGGNCTHEE